MPSYGQQRVATRKMDRACGAPVDDAAGVQKVKPPGDVHSDLVPLIVPSIRVRFIQHEGLLQVAALLTQEG